MRCWICTCVQSIMPMVLGILPNEKNVLFVCVSSSFSGNLTNWPRRLARADPTECNTRLTVDLVTASLSSLSLHIRDNMHRNTMQSAPAPLQSRQGSSEWHILDVDEEYCRWQQCPQTCIIHKVHHWSRLGVQHVVLACIFSFGVGSRAQPRPLQKNNYCLENPI